MEEKNIKQEENIWVQLREALDGTGIGFYSLPSGVEIEYLKHLFTEEHARIYVALGNRLKPLDEIAKRLKKTPEELKPILEEMRKKALVISTKTDPVFYAPMPYLPGIGDFSTIYEDKETAELAEKYRMTDEIPVIMVKSPLRAVPIQQALSSTKGVAPYDDVIKIIEKQDKIAVSRCYCSTQDKKLGREVVEPMERCFSFGIFADFTEEMGFGRKCSREEAIEIVKKCEEVGLVHQPSDLQNPFFICNCGKNCTDLRLKRRNPKPYAMDWMNTNYYAVVDETLCNGCEVCVDRCVMETIKMGERGVAEVNLENCIGCGLCVTTCPAEAVTLKEKSKHYTPGDTHPALRKIRLEDYAEDLAPYMNIIKPL